MTEALGRAEFRLLGSVGVWAGDELIGPSTAQQRSVLATLLLNLGGVVSLDRLAEAVWGQQQPPASARNAVQGYVSRVRRVLAVIPDTELATSSPGYRLDLDPMRVDLYRFRDLVRRAGSSGPEEARGLLRQALGLWRGTPLADVAGDWLQGMFEAGLRDERLTALEQRIAADLRCGRHREPLAELPQLLNEHPLRERLVYLTMTALYQNGRRAAALEVFRDARARLVEELGIEPDVELQNLHLQILDADSAGAQWAYGSPAVPAELPADVATFTGRSAEVARLTGLLGADGRARVGICQISGTGGIGKSALAIHVAHAVADRFPDGHLYVNLQGATPEVDPVTPLAALGRFLRSLGMADSAVPANVEEAAGRFRSLTDGKRLLIVLDNARDAAQVRPLLPGSPTCAVLVTSRRMLTSFEDAVRVPLDVLTDEEGLALLSGVAGAGRIAAEPAAAAEVVRLCGSLPLALCLAGARLSARPSWPVSTLARRLTTARRRLDELRTDDRAVRASFRGSYHDLLTRPQGVAAARMFRLLGLIDGQDLGLPVAAALADLPDVQARDLLDHLVDAQLVDNHSPDRYRLHDLLRLFAREQAHEEETTTAQQQAVERVLHCYLATARLAVGMVKGSGSWRTAVGPRTLTHPGVTLETSEDLHAWIDAEEDNVLAVVGQAAHTPAADLAVALAMSFAVSLYERGHWLKQLALCELALRAAEHSGDILLQAHMYGDLGWTQICTGWTAEGIVHLHRSLTAYQECGHPLREAALLDQIGIAYRASGHFDKAIEYHLRALRTERGAGDDGPWREAVILTHLGLAYQRAGRFDEAIDLHTRAMTIFQEFGVTIDGVCVRIHLGEAYRLAGKPEEAVSHYRQALGLYQADGHLADYREAEISWGLGLALHDLGELDEARRFRRRSAAILHRLGLVTGEEKHAMETSAEPDTPKVIQRQL
ncbi:BTAD domain-containing putative transcriptional regulator [Nonomuraea sp. B12E4]|uniref:AfsR/SARP family transcriptional regulator n=1 Tax=Nonomuraea sp. B12E4 TaxID=3153564 RepID=UPI00325C4C68